MVFFGLFNDKKEDTQKENFIAVHCRRLDCSPPYDCLSEYSSNVKVYGQWALQIGNLFYEIVEPKYAIAWRLLDSLGDESLRRVACSLEDDTSGAEIHGKDDGHTPRSRIMEMLRSNANSEGDEPTLDREDDPFILGPNKPGKGLAGETGDEALVPLVISKGREWSTLPKSDHAIIPMRTLPITSGRGVSEARYMYKEVFRWGYEGSTYNSHAFVLYLLFAMQILHDKLQYDGSLYRTMWENSQQRLFKDPSMDFPNLGASLIIYRMWGDIVDGTPPDVKVKWETDAGPAGRNWVIEWRDVNYRQIVPPSSMRESLENLTLHLYLSDDVPIDARTHAVRAIKQARHDLAQNRPKILSDAVMRQLRTEQRKD